MGIENCHTLDVETIDEGMRWKWRKRGVLTKQMGAFKLVKYLMSF